MVKPVSDVARDFDRIAAALADGPVDRRLSSAEHAVLNAIPESARSVLDVGCGDGLLTRAIARRGIAVTGIDVAAGMIALARARTNPAEPIQYRVDDVMRTKALAPSYDAVVCVNVVHHAPLALIVPRLAALVAPGGVLVIQDVVTRPGWRYLPLNLIAGVWIRGRRWVGRDRVSRHVRRLYDEHGRGETYLEPSAVLEALAAYVPGVRVTHHLGWRYTAVWFRAAATRRL